ncbi:hypothetical protein CH276_11025 [Rhodococcus sp. 06-470-2]|nr:hypothetical protein CH276_11025 [Rhodococcus sp. 06-470-2]OZE70972.1 hypothetical protein CH265_03810 [Rhodococcus sp. 05-2221-1B]
MKASPPIIAADLSLSISTQGSHDDRSRRRRHGERASRPFTMQEAGRWVQVDALLSVDFGWEVEIFDALLVTGT